VTGASAEVGRVEACAEDAGRHQLRLALDVELTVV